MKKSELKLRLISGVYGLVDTYFGSDTMIDKFINSSLKIAIKQKSYMINDALVLFTDENDEVDLEMMIDEYSKLLKDEKITIDIRDYVDNQFIKNMLPNKSLVVKFEDILNMLI